MLVTRAKTWRTLTQFAKIIFALLYFPLLLPVYNRESQDSQISIQLIDTLERRNGLALIFI